MAGTLNRITEGMMIADTSLAEGGYNYYGYVRKDGAWVIIRENTGETEYRYRIGSENYSTGWSGRTGLNFTIPTVL